MDSQSLCTDASTTGSGSGSRSGSAKSNTSEEPKRQEDYTKDNAASPVDLECHIQAERITKILDEAISKVKLCLCLPLLLHRNQLQPVMSEQNYEDLIFIYDQYENPLFSTSLQNVTAMDDLKAGDTSMKNRINPELGHLMYILNSYPEVINIANDIVLQMKDTYESYVSRPPQPGLEYLLKLETFRDLMEIQMNKTAAEVLADKIKIRKVEAANAKLKAEIAEAQRILAAELLEFEEKMATKTTMIKMLEEEIALWFVTARVKLDKQILDSERQMVLMSRAHAVKYEILMEEDRDSRELYDKTLKDHMNVEKKLQDRRRKCETQLQSWLQKYDQEMSDKQMELDEFDEKCKGEQEKIDKLEEKMAEQDKDFEPLMAEREGEYHAEMEAKQKQFMLEHAARVIQTSWREVLANRAEKKKLKKMIKILKEKQAAAQRAAEKEAAAAAAAAKKAAKAAKKK